MNRLLMSLSLAALVLLGAPRSQADIRPAIPGEVLQEAPAIPDAESSAPAPKASIRGAELLAALRRGGYVIYFRR